MAVMSNRSFLSRWLHLRRPSAQLVLLASDLLALFGTAFVIAALREIFGGMLNTPLHVQLSVFLLVAPAINYVNDLYSSTALPTPEELRSLAIATSLSYLGIAIYFFLGRTEDTPSRLVYLLSWLFSLGTVPLLRALMRRLFAKASWWGVPTVLLGPAAQSKRLAEILRRHPSLGFRPTAYAMWDNDPMDSPLVDDLASSGIRPLFGTRALQNYVRRCRRKRRDVCALLSIPLHASIDWRTTHVNQTMRHFPMVVLVPEEFAAEGVSFWVRPLEIGPMLGLKVRQNLLDPRRLALKRCMDLCLSAIMGLCLLPVLAGIALAIRLESPGSPLFRQRRIGVGGQEIFILKFRTMVQDAEAHLARCLARDPELQREWDADQKLRNDPRITRVGALLRRTSLDELPQLWNVLCGEMSLVGPRPIVDSEVAKYGDTFAAYMRVRPGITGLWQVSGRNDLSYAERVRLDAWYISNWSTWLDLYILAKTAPVVFQRKGAY